MMDYPEPCTTPNGPGHIVAHLESGELWISHKPATLPAELLKVIWHGGPCVFLKYQDSEVTR